MKSFLGMKSLMLLLTACAIGCLGVLAYQYLDGAFSTAAAYGYRVEEGVSLSGCLVRRERVLEDGGGELMRLQREEGERVGAGGTVATVYADQASLDRQSEIAALENRVEQLRYAQEASASTEVSLKLDSQIEQAILDYRRELAEEQLADAEEHGSTLRALVLKRDYTFSGDLSAQMEEVQAELQALRAQAAGSVRRITAPVSGLYSAVVDGYENVLTPESLEGLTPSSLAALRPDETVSSNVGKLVLGDAWYYAAALPVEEARRLEEVSSSKRKAGDSLVLRFSKTVERDLPVTVERIGAEENGKAVVIFRGETYLNQLTVLRQQSALAVTGSVEGVRVPTEALRLVAGTETDGDGAERQVQRTGVYCIVGAEARFKPVDVLYTGEGFVLVRSSVKEGQEKLRLRPGDEVIVSGKDLFDGKVVRSETDSE